jgi:NAD(P)-dependent dehydrogenase (short-subunit alcohol dehydrogenase family)
VGAAADIGAFEYQSVQQPVLPGDYNGSHFVDAADYVLWRKNKGTSVAQYSGADGDGSSVILVSSLGAHAAVGTLSAYAATKGAIDTLVKYFAAALGPRGIRVNAVAPGVIDTDMSNLVKTDEGKSFVLGMQAFKRIGQPDDVGSVVAFLASQDARWITGDTIRVDGGSKL